MTEQKTRKVLDINAKGAHIYCMEDKHSQNPYKVYQEWYGCDGKRHTHKLNEFYDFISVLCYAKIIFE
jgi:hypothetical protein